MYLPAQVTVNYNPKEIYIFYINYVRVLYYDPQDGSDILKLVVCILLRLLGQVQGFRLTQHCFEYFIQ
jgi:hypothetical protein